MRTLNRIADLRALVQGWRMAGETVAFVPTMGNLHAGHASLIDAAHHHGRRVVASVFVNPLQFGPTEDYAAYPRTPDEDAVLLAAQGVDALLLPVVDHALRRGLEPARAGRIDIAARVDGGHLRIVVTDNGLPEHAAETPSPDTDALRERLLALFGGRARFVPRADGPGGTTAILELPRAS